MHSILKQTAVLAALACILLLSGCSASGEKSAPVTPPAPVMVVELQPQDAPIVAEFAAQTYARDTVDVRSHVQGYLE